MGRTNRSRDFPFGRGRELSIFDKLFTHVDGLSSIPAPFTGDGFAGRIIETVAESVQE